MTKNLLVRRPDPLALTGAAAVIGVAAAQAPAGRAVAAGSRRGGAPVADTVTLADDSQWG
ncbi:MULTISPECIES: hypothetical protein [Streptomyces]|uniref:hypothetical protein n=1 Tax=Streptomyces TaxID=1883 RepID=UPI0007EC953D|nr:MULTISPECIES: hypothetical protein [unclassified Streptomyces]MCP3767466.1 hypothetical protein [Streptomyces sp. MAR25Y5]OBQ53582.1 hypothetical protein A4U61_05315 [Streptomyces sp. H-KF8]